MSDDYLFEMSIRFPASGNIGIGNVYKREDNIFEFNPITPNTRHSISLIKKENEWFQFESSIKWDKSMIDEIGAQIDNYLSKTS
jgi:hypothetical protein